MSIRSIEMAVRRYLYRAHPDAQAHLAEAEAAARGEPSARQAIADYLADAGHVYTDEELQQALDLCVRLQREWLEGWGGREHRH